MLVNFSFVIFHLPLSHCFSSPIHCLIYCPFLCQVSPSLSFWPWLSSVFAVCHICLVSSFTYVMLFAYDFLRFCCGLPVSLHISSVFLECFPFSSFVVFVLVCYLKMVLIFCFSLITLSSLFLVRHFFLSCLSSFYSCLALYFCPVFLLIFCSAFFFFSL